RPALVEIGLAAVRQLDIRLLARPVLEDLAATFAETAHLTILDRPGSDGPSELPSLTKRSVTSLTRLRAELRRVRERGYALNTEESEDGVASVAVAVLCHRDAPIAALAVSAPVTRLDAKMAGRFAARLRADADRLAELTSFES